MMEKILFKYFKKRQRVIKKKMLSFWKVAILFVFGNLLALSKIQQVNGQCWAPWKMRTAVARPCTRNSIEYTIKELGPPGTSLACPCPNPATQENFLGVCVTFI